MKNKAKKSRLPQRSVIRDLIQSQRDFQSVAFSPDSRRIMTDGADSTSPLPAAGTSAVWKFKAIYRLHDEQVGHWSDVVSVSVMG